MSVKAPVSEAHIQRVLAEAEAGQAAAGATPTETDREIARRQIIGELSGDEAVNEAVSAALARFSEA